MACQSSWCLTHQCAALALALAGGTGPQPQLGPLLAGRLAALAAMRRLRRSSVGESPDVPAASGQASSSSRRGLQGGAGNSKPVSLLAAVGPAAGRSAAAAAAGVSMDRGGVLRASQGSCAGHEGLAGAGVRAAAASGSSRAAAAGAAGAAAAGMGQARQGVRIGAERQPHSQQQQLDQGPLAKQLSAQRWHQQQPSRRRSSVGGESSVGSAAASTGTVQVTHSRVSLEHSQQVQQTLGEQVSVLLQRMLYGEGSEGVPECAAGAGAGGSVLSHRSSSGSRG
jgi:hypothetical protein